MTSLEPSDGLLVVAAAGAVLAFFALGFALAVGVEALLTWISRDRQQ